MELRDHPRLVYHKIPSWPPPWMWIGMKKRRYPQGEVGVLKKLSAVPVRKRCFLTIECDNESYMGCLFVSDASFCQQLFTVLQQHLGSTIEQIGGLDVT